MNTPREHAALENARVIAGRNLLLAARMNEREARLRAKDEGEEAKYYSRLARTQRRMLREAKGKL